MSDLAQLLGQPTRASQILDMLRQSDAHVWLEGPSGSGKTEIARAVAEQWKRGVGDQIYVAGDREQNDTPLFPLYRALKGWKLSRALRRVARDEGAAPLRDIPIVGNTLAFAMGLLGTSVSKAPQYLNEGETDMLSDLQSYSREGMPLLITLDNVHWLDDATCRLICRLWDNDIRESFSFARRVRVLCIETCDQPPTVDRNWLTRLRNRASSQMHVELPSKEVFLQVLTAMGMKAEVPKEVIDKLYFVTRGHLKIAEQIVRIANESTGESMRLTTAASLDELAMKLLEARIQMAEIAGGKVERLLRIAACIGQTFSLEELRCAFSEPETFASALEIAKREEYLRGGEEFRFAHEIIQSALASRGEPPAYHAKLLECFKTLRPGDYSSRLRHAILAGDTSTASELAFALRAQSIRGDNVPGAPSFEQKVDDCLAPCRDAVEAYRLAIKQMDEGAHQEAISTLAAFSARDGIVGAEINYVLALNYFKLRTIPAYKAAESLLSHALAQVDELELWCRLQSTQAVILAHLGRAPEADRARTSVIARLKKCEDSWAKTRRMILHRTASVVMPPEPACAEIASAVEYFAPSKGALMPRQAFQYVAALVNYSGVLFDLGRYESSADSAALALEVQARVQGIARTVERYKICNNLAIASLRSKRFTPSEAVSLLHLALQAEPQTHDRLLLLSNLAVAEALAGDIQQSLHRLQTAFEQVSADRPDAFYYYVVASNLAALFHLAGHNKKGLKLWRTLSDHIKDLSDYDFAVLSHRQSMLEEAFKQVPEGNALQWDSFLDREPPRFGDSWFFYRYGFVLSDIVVWSES